MGFESGVSGLRFKTARIAGSVSTVLRGWGAQILRGVYPEQSRRARDDKPAQRNLGPSTAPELETRDARPETFFDSEFLKKLERLRLIAKRLSWAGAKGEHPASRKGFSLEFADYRRYQKGDDLRYVDWNVYRRLERLLLKVFTAEEEMNVYLLIDTSRSMGEGAPPKIDYAKRVAAALGYVGLKNLDRVGGASFTTALRAPLTLGRGRKQILNLFDFLGKLTCSGETDLRAAIHTFTKLFPHPGLVVIVSDLFEPAGWRAGLEELATKRYQLLVIHIVDEQEISPKLAGDILLSDVESGRERRFFLDGDLLRRYREELASYFAEIEALCAGRRIDYLRTSTAVPFDDFVLKTLRQIGSVS
jgi:uncharacterized protein (DUF58 family)